MYPVLKENKIFSWETFPLCFSFPPFSFCSFLLGRLPGSAPCLLPLETPPGRPLLAPAVGPALPGAWAVRRLARPCSPSVQPSPRPGGQREGQRMAVWPQVHGESRQPVSQLCLPALPAQPWVCSPGFRHTLGFVCSASLPAAIPQKGGGGPGSWLPPPTPPGTSGLCISGEVAELCHLASGHVGGTQGGLGAPVTPLASSLAQHFGPKVCPVGSIGGRCAAPGKAGSAGVPATPSTRQESWVLRDGQRSWSGGRPGASWTGRGG